MSAIRDDDVGILLGGFDELIVHGLQHVAILADEHLQRVSTLGDVTCDDTQQALVGLGIYKYLDVHEVAHALVVQCHDALHDDDILRFDAGGLVGAVVLGKVVNRAVDGLTGCALWEEINILWKNMNIPLRKFRKLSKRKNLPKKKIDGKNT